MLYPVVNIKNLFGNYKLKPMTKSVRKKYREKGKK